jgi:hypothetical protein
VLTPLLAAATSHQEEKVRLEAADGIFAVLDPNTRGRDEFEYRVKLDDALAGLGPRFKSEENYETLRQLRKRELTKKYEDIINAAGRALAAMNPN